MCKGCDRESDETAGRLGRRHRCTGAISKGFLLILLLSYRQIHNLKLLSAFFRLVRWPNLVFIALTQVLFEYSIFQKVYKGTAVYEGEQRQFLFIVIASVLIAAAGYIINDYFYLNID